jgi:predicted nucleotidyltransferase
MIREGKPLPADVKEKVPVVVKRVSNDPEIVALYAFGSLAEDTLKPLSDLDFAVLLSGRLNYKQRFDKHLEFIGKFNSIFHTDDIDLVMLNEAPPRFSFHITSSGTVLFCSDRPALVDFIERTRKLYLDFKYFRDSFDKAFLRGIGYYG